MNKRGLSEGASPDIVICHGFLLITLLDLELTHNWNASVLVQLNQRESKVKETCVGPVFHNLHANAREIRVKWGSLSPTLIQPGHRWYITKRDNKFLQSKHYRSFFLKIWILLYVSLSRQKHPFDSLTAKCLWGLNYRMWLFSNNGAWLRSDCFQKQSDLSMIPQGT